MDRRLFLAGLAATTVAALSGCAQQQDVARPTRTPAAVHPSSPPPRPTPTSSPPPLPVVKKSAITPGERIIRLPGNGDLLAWTVDDGVSSHVVAAYAQFAQESGIRLTFFLNGVNASWTDNAPALRPLVESGQVQLANHTWDHADLTTLSSGGIERELRRNGDFIKNTYGVEAAPFYRPPYGYLNRRVEAVASSIGYTAPVMWYGSLADSSLLTPQQIVANAQQWFLPQHIVIGHANYDPVTQVYGQLLDIIRQRGLRTVTLRDVFAV
ncbi:polysaccharide deacetylase family protein [Humibacter antri]